MLLEAFVAVIALSTVMIASNVELAGKAPGTIYGLGLGRYLAELIGQDRLVFATTFGMMAFSTFVFDTLDVSTRLGRYVLQELSGSAGRSARAPSWARCSPTVIPLGFLLAAGEGAYRQFWVLFGTSNQLLAALSLLAISVWLKRSSRRSAFTWIPMAFVLIITVWSLVMQAIAAVRGFRGVARHRRAERRRQRAAARPGRPARVRGGARPACCAAGDGDGRLKEPQQTCRPLPTG